ncbi:phage major capsid protein [Paraburkholderia susongensis]|uniref:Phage major capsid protein, HK97 family n=1 Tax=Paraburkholderia susongensis TaxID=1515439 RepID=A0A1X7I6U6_9BURK|nr:phage major capsid protein [Paraburkholderia susongensis]SMG09553.1 phage major capsid protein, HK97 family [Paraburkholderia susongensis]
MAVQIQALRERRDAIAKNINLTMENFQGDKWGPEQQKIYDDGIAEMDRIKAEISRHEKLMAELAADALNGKPAGLINAVTKTPGAHSGESRVMRMFLQGGLRALEQEDIQAMRRRQSPDIQAAMSSLVGEEGGYTVAEEWYRQLTEALKEFGGIRRLATVIQTGTGAQMHFPAADATSEEGEIVGQNEEVSTSTTRFSTLAMTVFKYSSKSIALPFELLQDSMFDLDAYIRNLLAVRIGRITSRHFVTGRGDNEPHGILTEAPLGWTTVSSEFGYDDFVDLEHSVDPIYRRRTSAGWIMNDNSLRKVRKIKDDVGRPIFVPGYEQGNPGGAPDRLLNRPLEIIQEMPDAAAGNRPILFGDASQYLIRDVMDLTMFRMTDSFFTTRGQVGFLAFNRQGGRLIDVGGAVKALAIGAGSGGGNGGGDGGGEGGDGGEASAAAATKATGQKAGKAGT